jgi:uncharacterized protein (DUF2345 family)
MNKLLGQPETRMPNDWRGAEMPTDWDKLLQCSTDWAREVQQLQEADDFARWEDELASPTAEGENRDYSTKHAGSLALKQVVGREDSVRITSEDSVRITMDDSVRITAHEDSVRITAQDDSVRITAADSVRITAIQPDYALAA